jgi:hypothetical protein
MIEITFNDFHDYNYPDEGYELYVMKNGLGDVLYVGISENNIWGRWFSFGGHMIWDGRHIIGQSSVGEKIADHMPDSLDWKIQLWLLDDCVRRVLQGYTSTNANIYYKICGSFHDSKVILYSK